MADNKLLEFSDFGGFSLPRLSLVNTIPIPYNYFIPALSLEKTMYRYPKREKKSGLRTKIKSFHSGYLD